MAKKATPAKKAAQVKKTAAKKAVQSKKAVQAKKAVQSKKAAVVNKAPAKRALRSAKKVAFKAAVGPLMASVGSDPIMDKVISAIKNNTGPVIIAPHTSLASIGLVTNLQLEGLAGELRSTAHFPTLVLSGKEMRALLTVAGGDTVVNLRNVVDNRTRKVKDSEILPGVKKATRIAWGGTAGDQAQSFAARGKNRSDIKNLRHPIVAVFLELISDIVEKSDLKTPDTPAEVAAIIEAKLTAAGRL